jgi:hypothetical protein
VPVIGVTLPSIESLLFIVIWNWVHRE